MVPDSCGWQNPRYSVILPNIITILKNTTSEWDIRTTEEQARPGVEKKLSFVFLAIVKNYTTLL